MASIPLLPSQEIMDKGRELRDSLAYFEARKADALLHLERARKARMRAPRDCQAMSDFYHYMAEVELILKELSGEYEAPEVLEGYQSELQQIRRAA